MSWAQPRERDSSFKTLPGPGDYAVVRTEEGRLPETPRKAGPRSAWLLSDQVLQCQLAVAGVQTSFVIGSVYLKSSFRLVQGLHFHPIIFAFAREAVAGPILCLAAYMMTGDWPKRSDLLHIWGLGLCLYLNQLFYILGIDMSGVLVATCMQPAIPVITALLGVLLGLESGSLQKFVGIFMAVAGSICMVLGGVLKSNTTGTGNNLLLGNLCLVANTVSMALYYILAKHLVTKYNPICVAAWAYILAASMMGATAALTIDRNEWIIPPALYGPLLYWIFVASITGYYLLTWACQRLPASQVAAFQCLQPFFGTILAFLFLGERPTAWDLGGIGVISGLVLVTREVKDAGPKTVSLTALAKPQKSTKL